MKLFTELRTKYGQATVKTIRDYENNVRKISRHRNHLVFSLRCRDEGLTPPSLQLKCPINTSKARDIIQKAKRDLLRERIRVINNKLGNLKSVSEKYDQKLKSSLPVSVLDNVTQHIAKSREKEFQKTKCRHVNKLDRLVKKQAEKNARYNGNNRHAGLPDLSGEQLKKWVVNLSKYKLNKTENEVLALGLNFCPTTTELPVDDFIVATEKACWQRST